jgi:hypothetical protein
MDSQEKVADLAVKRQSSPNLQTISGQFRLADTDSRLKCLFWDAMHNRASTGTVELETAYDNYGLLHFPHNVDSQLGTGRIKAQRQTLQLERPNQGVGLA